MNSQFPTRLIESLARIEPVMAAVWLGLFLFTCALAVLMYTRWGQYRPLRKCMGLSLLAHLILACYATTIQVAAPMLPPAQAIRVSIGDGPDENLPAGGASANANAKGQPWEVLSDQATSRPKPLELERHAAPKAEPKRLVRADNSPLASEPSLDHVATTAVAALMPTAAANAARMSPIASKPAAKIDAPIAQRRDALESPVPEEIEPVNRLAGELSGRPMRISSHELPPALVEQLAPMPPISDSEAGLPGNPSGGSPNQFVSAALRAKSFERDAGDEGAAAFSAGGFAAVGFSRAGLSGTASIEDQPLPDVYRLRIAPDKADVAESRGGTAETEAAVKRALKWLADNQDADGRWNPRTHAGGKEENVLGRNRQNAGSHSDSAMTGLALLAFLASGHTHLEGPYREDVRRGLEYLLRTQAADGNLAGQAAPYEFMYCHAMAAFALSEAYGMTHDARLREPVGRAVSYTLRAQDPVGGGWRYRPGDAGDTSQLGWQLMVLKSAELAGVPVPDSARQGIIRYLRSVCSGQYGGRASYRPGELTTRTMTAEALVCWQFLGLPRQNPACDEAGDVLLAELPGDSGDSNFYYWYYATLGMYQLQGVHWQRWNDALRQAVVSRQVKDGPQGGSWDTNDLWGGHGGRIYTTALATLTLEVYYRFLPLYAEVAPGVARASTMHSPSAVR